MSRLVRSQNVADHYGIYADDESCIGRLLFVTSVDLDDWVLASDLPEYKYKALQGRIEREHRIPKAEGVRDILVEEHARAAAKLDEVIDDLVGERFPNVPLDTVRGGVRLALEDLGKQGTRQEARLERRFRAMEPVLDRAWFGAASTGRERLVDLPHPPGSHCDKEP
jgi:hypothetical protein